MAMSAILSPYWDGEEYVISNDEKIGDAEPVTYGKGCGVGEIAAWLDGDFGFLGVGSDNACGRYSNPQPPMPKGVVAFTMEKVMPYYASETYSWSSLSGAGATLRF